ncbi:MAG: TIGR00341 family protein [Methanomicrobiales archaeon]
MVFRLIEIVVPNDKKDEAVKILKKCEVLDFSHSKFSKTHTRFNIFIRSERTERILEVFQKRYSELEGFRVVIIPVETYIPTPEDLAVENVLKTDETEHDEERISREELYTKVSDTSRMSYIYLAMVILSSFVAAIGVLNDDVAVIIGGMILAPLLGPTIGISFSMVMGDFNLAKTAIRSSLMGIGLAIVISMVLGFFLNVDPTIPSILLRTNIARGGIVLAIASGFAGSLALVTDISSAVVGVMIAVALLPPLVTFGLLLGSGEFLLAIGAFLIFLVNFVAIIFAGILTFIQQRIHPLEEEQDIAAKKMSSISLLILGVILAILIIINFDRTIIYGIL